MPLSLSGEVRRLHMHMHASWTVGWLVGLVDGRTRLKISLSVVCGEVSRERVAVESECNVDVPDCRDVSCAVV